MERNEFESWAAALAEALNVAGCGVDNVTVPGPAYTWCLLDLAGGGGAIFDTRAQRLTCIPPRHLRRVPGASALGRRRAARLTNESWGGRMPKVVDVAGRVWTAARRWARMAAENEKAGD